MNCRPLRLQLNLFLNIPLGLLLVRTTVTGWVSRVQISQRRLWMSCNSPFFRPSTKLQKLKSKYLLAPSKLFLITEHPELSGEFSQSSFIFYLVTGVLEDQSQEGAHQLILVTRHSPLHSQLQLSFQTIWLQYLISKHSKTKTQLNGSNKFFSTMIHLPEPGVKRWVAHWI